MKEAFVEDDKWGMVWIVHPALMKAKGRNGFSQAWRRPHALPLPPMAQTVVRRALELSRSDSIWLFPQTKRRYATDALDKHVHVRTLNSQLEYLQEPGKPLHSDRPFASHTVRKSFSTHLSQKRGKECPHEIRRLVLDHSEGRAETVEDLHYDVDPSMPEKFKALMAWQEIIEECMAKVTNELAA